MYSKKSEKRKKKKKMKKKPKKRIDKQITRVPGMFPSPIMGSNSIIYHRGSKKQIIIGKHYRPCITTEKIRNISST
jgi:hypothetical protein